MPLALTVAGSHPQPERWFTVTPQQVPPRAHTPPPRAAAAGATYEVTGMAVTMVMEIPGASEEHYNKVLEAIGHGHEGHLEDGQLAHIAAPMEGGWRVVDVWESEDHFNKFARERLGAAIAANIPGAANAPPPTFYPVRTFHAREA